jgi:streptogramin lyase
MRQAITALALFSLIVVLSGCSASFAPQATSATTTAGIGAIHGVVHGGRQPIAGARLYALETNTLAYSTPGAPAASTSQITVGSTAYPISTDTNGFNYITTDAAGGFNLPADTNTCIPGGIVYLYITGGNPGAGTNVVSGLLAVLGVCPASGFVSDTVTTGVDVNELTTIAAAYTLAPFATDALHIGAPVYTSARPPSVLNTNVATALQNSATLASELVTLSSGTANANGTSGTGILPQSVINTLGNILAACINTPGNTTGPSSSTCSADFTDVYSGGATGTSATQAADTASLAIFMARYPAITSYIIPPALGSPYQPSLSNAPADYTLAINYATGSNPLGVAIDGAGNAWVTNSNNFGGGGTVAEVTASGTVNSFTTGGITTPVGVAVDQAGSIWITDTNAGLIKLNPDGTQASGSFTTSSIASPAAIAIDAIGNPYISDVVAKTIYYINASGDTGSGSPILNGAGFNYSGMFNYPSGLALDQTGNIWVADVYAGPPGSGGQGTGAVFELSTTGAELSGTYGYGTQSDGSNPNGIHGPYSLAFDSASNAWIPNSFAPTIIKLSDDGMTSATFGSTSFTDPLSAAIDGNGNAWATNSDTVGTVFEFANDGTILSSAGGYASGQLQSPGGVAVDASGNVWITNSNANYVTELIGAAAPTLTPLAANLAPGKTPASRP